MEDLKISDLIRMQEELQEKYRGIWEPMEPVNARNKLLWMMEEYGEVVALIKKRGEEQIRKCPEVRSAFVEELADVMMYYIDVLLCYGITAEEWSELYQKKHERNMRRNFQKEHSVFLPDGEQGD